MIVMRVWRRDKGRAQGGYDTRVFKGWFLLGIIPLYIRVVSYDLGRE